MIIYWVHDTRRCDAYSRPEMERVDEADFYVSREEAESAAAAANEALRRWHEKDQDRKEVAARQVMAEHTALVAAGLRSAAIGPPEHRREEYKPTYEVREVEVID